MIPKQFLAQSIQAYGVAYNTRDPLVMKWADAHINGLLGVLPDEIEPKKEQPSVVQSEPEQSPVTKKRGRRKKV